MLINETDFGVFSVKGAENPKIDFLKARLRRAFKKSVLNNENCWQICDCQVKINNLK
jgi:hypothetical protein